MYKCLIFSLLLFSCGASKHTGRKDLTRTEAKTVGAIMRSVDAQALPAAWLSTRMALDISTSGQQIGADGALRIQRDTAIWLNIKKFGIELARVYITRDSVKAIIPVQNSYVSEDIQYLADHFGLPAKFEWIQAMLMGEAVWPLDSSMMTMSSDTSRIKLTGVGAGFKSNYDINTAATRLNSAQYEIPAQNTKISLEQTNWGLVLDKFEFPYLRTWKMSAPDYGTTIIEMRFSDLVFTDVKPMRFEIPAHYARIRP